MTVFLVVLVPIITLVVWGIIFDLKRRRRHAVLTNHDIGSAARRAQADAGRSYCGVDRLRRREEVTDRLQFGAGFPCGNSPRALPLISLLRMRRQR